MLCSCPLVDRFDLSFYFVHKINVKHYQLKLHASFVEKVVKYVIMENDNCYIFCEFLLQITL